MISTKKPVDLLLFGAFVYRLQQFLTKLLGYEIRKREEKQLAKRLKWADFPVHQSLDEFDISASLP